MTVDSSELRSAADVPRAHAPGLYVHVPFCFHKCHYCDFYSITRQSPERMTRYVDLTLAEAAQWARSHVTVKPQTIFFGGGTPSLLPLADMRRLLTGLRATFDFSALDEFTIEVNPATAALDYCQMLREHGVDRLSFGAQSFDRDELKLLERHHDPEDVPRSLDLARQAGFSRLNVDLIYAVPGQTPDRWLRSLDAAVALRTPHLSCYGLTYESNTPITVRKRLGQFQPVEDSVELDMLRQTRARLAAAGYQAYEISNYAVPGEACRHNLLYWTGGNYVGLGPSAASHVDGWRWKNRPHLGEWESAVASGHLPGAELEKLTPDQRRGEWVMLRLRLAQGVEFAAYADRWGSDARVDYAAELAQLTSVGLLHADDTRFALTESGLAVADAVAAEFLRV